MEEQEKPNCMVCEFRIKKNGRKWTEWQMECEFQSFEVQEITIDGERWSAEYHDHNFDLGYLKAVNWLYQSRRNSSPQRAEFRITPQYRSWASKRREFIYKMLSE